MGLVGSVEARFGLPESWSERWNFLGNWWVLLRCSGTGEDTLVRSSGMPEDVRQLYVMVNPMFRDLVKVGKTQIGVDKRAEALSSGLPQRYEVYGYVDFPLSVTPGQLHELEQEAHRRLDGHRPNKKREHFAVDPEMALRVLKEVREDCLKYLSKGLTVLGNASQPELASMPVDESPKAMSNSQRRERRRAQNMAEREDRKARQHWHVWVETKRSDSQQIIGLTLDPRVYWSKSGANGRVKREAQREVGAEIILCRDRVCPAFDKRRDELL